MSLAETQQKQARIRELGALIHAHKDNVDRIQDVWDWQNEKWELQASITNAGTQTRLLSRRLFRPERIF